MMMLETNLDVSIMDCYSRDLRPWVSAGGAGGRGPLDFHTW